MSKNLMHNTVLLNEAVIGLKIREDGIYLDCTFGRGGHSKLILSKLKKEGKLIAIDRDPEAVFSASIINDTRFKIIHGLFSEITKHITKLNLVGRIDGVLLDLGLSSPQIDNPNRGFSFMRDGPLDMRMDTTSGLSAANWLATASETDIAFVLKTFGEERFANRIARAIFKRSHQKPINRTRELARLIASSSPYIDSGKHPARRSFQAIRIYINRELEELKLALNGSLSVLAPGGRLSVISFHSLEDRLVKYFIRQHSCKQKVPNGIPLNEDQITKYYNKNIQLKIAGKIKPSEFEISNNPRARSAILRLAEKLPI